MTKSNVQCYSFLHDLLKESTSLLNNYLSLGQFEQARSYALILKDKYPSYFIEFVHNIIQDGVPKEWVFTKSVPTASHLIWLLYTEYKGIQNIKSVCQNILRVILCFLTSFKIDSNQLIRSEIDILLYTFSSIGVINGSSHKELLEIYRLLNLDVDITIIDISDETKNNLKSSFKTDPILASSLIFYFRKSDAPVHFKMHVIKQILDILVDVINESIDQSNFDLAFKLLKHLHADQHSLPITSHELFKKIINLYFPYDTHNIRRKVYSSLLSLHHEQNYALTCFSSIEKEIYYTHSTSSNSALPFPFHAFKIPTLNHSEAFSMFWNQYYNFITSSNQHFLEYIIIRFFELINENNFEDIRTLLAPFERLKPLLLLMAWNKNGNDIIYRERLIDVLWSGDELRSKNINLDLLDKCNELSNKIDLALWCGEHFVAYSNEISSLIGGAMTIFKNETDEYKISNSLYEIIDVYSIPYLIHPFFHKISSQDICNILHKSGQKDNDSLEDDLTLIDSYFCLKYIIDLLEKCRNKEINQDIIKEYIDMSSNHLKSIKSTEAKVFLIECIFSLLFIQEKAWNKENNSSSIDKDRNTEKFIVTPMVAIKLLNYLKVSIETIIMSDGEKIDDSIKKTKSKVDEFVWRTNLVINHPYFLSENDDNIMSILLATPKSLLIRSIKEQDFATSNDIIQFFKLNDNVSDIARIAELVAKIHKRLSKNNSFDITELQHPNLSKLQEFTILSDILISSINLKSKDYATCLKKVKGLLEEVNESIDDDLLLRFQNFVNRIELLMSDTDNNYAPYLAYSYTQSLENDDLIKYLKLMNSLREAVETLNFIMYSSSSESYNSEQLLKRVTLSLGEEVVEGNHDNLYLLNFLKQLLLIGMTLRDDQYIGKDNFFDLLRTSPTYLISDLVFKSGNFEKAEELSKELDKHLESVILVSINSSKLKKRNEDDLITNQVDKKSFNQKSKGLRRSTSLYSSLTSQSDYIIPGLADDTRDYNLNMDIVEYLKKSSPIISILACILCSPSDHFNPRFLKYALSSSQKHYFPLFNWVRIKARRFSLYYNTFLKENYDSLDFANDSAFSIDHHDEYELSRSNSFQKSNKFNMSSSVLGSSYYPTLGTPTASMGALGIGDDENNPLAKLKIHGSPENLNFDINSTPNDTYSGSVEISMTPQITKSESKYTVDVSYFDLDNIDFINDKDIQMDIETIFQSDYVEDEIEIYTKIVDKLISVGNIDKALDIADRMLPNGASDQLLRLIIKQNDGNESIWRIVMRLHDKTMAAHLILEYYTRWSPDIVLEVSEMCQYHLKLKNNETLLKKIVNIHEKISLYKNILTIIPNKWKTWQELDSSCSENLVSVVNILLSNKQYDIANSLAKIFGDTKLKRKIEEEYIFYLLTELHDTNTVKKLFIEMGDDDDIQMAESLLEVINTNKDRLFLIQYIMDKKKSSQNNVYIHTLTTKELGVKILLCLSPELQKVYQHLINRPTSIIESLLMSEQTSVLAKIFEEVPQVRNDELVIKYAKKALSTSNITNENETNIRGSKKFYIADELKEHTYSSAPSYTLASNILDLCYNNQLAAHTCLTVCDNLSLKLIGLKDRLDIVKIMHQLIYYAKVRLTKDGNDENPNLLQLCDTLLGKTELLLQLIFSATPDIAKNLSLSSFADTQKVRILRDKLIEQDMLDLALLVANKCGIEAEPIWAAKGLQLLQVAMYQEAKQLFKLCMVSPHDDDDQHYRINNLSSPKTPEDNVPLLNKIITVLESDLPLDTKNMAKKYNELNALKNNPALLKRFKAMDDANDEEDAIKAIESISKNRNQSDVHFKPRRKHTLDSNRYMQCVYYLQRYGTDELLMKFWLRHNLIEDALRHLMNKNIIDHKLFLSIIYHSISHNLFQRFKEAIMKIDPTLKKWREPLLNVCKELNAKKMYKLLIEFQILMKDYSRAGLTCIKLFSQHEDYSIRMHYLNAAQKYFSASLELDSQVDNPISKSDVNKYIKTARLQAKVTNFFHENAKDIIEPLPHEFSLFLPVEIKSKIAESIIVNHNFDLAFQIIQEYRLPASDIYHNAIKKIAKARQTKKIEELIKNIKPFSSDVDIDLCILAVINIYIEEFNDIAAAKELFPRMKTDALKCEALICFRQLKEAYILAAKINDMRLVTMIRDVALKYEMKREYELCEKFLSSRPQL